MSVAMWNCHSWPLDVSSSVKLPFSICGGPSAKVCSSAKFGVVVFKVSILNSVGGPSAKVGFVCQFLCTGIQGISALFPRGSPLAKVGSSAKLCVPVFKVLSAQFPWGVHLPKYVCLPSVVYWYSRHLCVIEWCWVHSTITGTPDSFCTWTLNRYFCLLVNISCLYSPKFIHKCSYSYTNVNVIVHIKSPINVYTVVANINITVHIKSANINVTVHINKH